VGLDIAARHSLEGGEDAVVTKALLLTLAPLAMAGLTQCGPSSGSDAGGDNNPITGVCAVAFEETVGGVQHRYPELVQGTRFVFGKAIFTCDVPPESHAATFELQTRRLGAGQPRRQVQYAESSRAATKGSAGGTGHVRRWRHCCLAGARSGDR
jgi:hypothetical protein